MNYVPLDELLWVGCHRLGEDVALGVRNHFLKGRRVGPDSDF